MKRALLAAAALTLALPLTALAGPRAVVTGVTSYTPAKAWNGFTILANTNSAKLVDMNGNLVHEWDLQGGNAQPGKVLPGGYLMTHIYPQYREAGQGNNTVAILDFDGNIVRKFNHLWKVSRPGDNMPKDDKGEVWIARGHHDYQIEGSSTGYYAPDTKVNLEGQMLMLMHDTSVVPKIAGDIKLLDDRIMIVDKDGKTVFDWKAAEHVDEFRNMLDNPNVKRRLNNGEGEFGPPPPPRNWSTTVSTGSTSTAPPGSDPTSGTMPATSAFIPTTSSPTAAKPATCLSSTTKRARWSGRWLLPLPVKTPTSARSTACTTPT